MKIFKFFTRQLLVKFILAIAFVALSSIIYDLLTRKCIPLSLYCDRLVGFPFPFYLITDYFDSQYLPYFFVDLLVWFIFVNLVAWIAEKISGLYVKNRQVKS